MFTGSSFLIVSSDQLPSQCRRKLKKKSVSSANLVVCMVPYVQLPQPFIAYDETPQSL